MKRIEKYTVTGLDKEMRIRDYLRGVLGFSTSLIARVKYGGVFLCGDVVHMRAQVKNGDEIEVHFPEETSEGIAPMEIALAVLYEDAEVLAVSKPTGMPTHPSRGNSLPTLANAVMGYFGGNFVFRPITRLDRDTSGIVLIAKTPLAASRLSADMKSGRFQKLYTAVASGIFEKGEGRIEAPIRRASEGDLRRVVAEDGKMAVTEYRVLKTGEDNTTLLEIRLLTGRTHQIRVHMAHIGHPLVGDFLYGEKAENGYMLHCSKLCFPHPKSREMITVVSKPPFID